MSVSRVDGIENQLLDRLPSKEYERLSPHLQRATLSRGQILYKHGDRIKHVYFPKDCLISLVAITEDAQLLEVGAVGSKGMLGLPAIVRVGKMPHRVVVQIAGEVWRISANILRAEFNEGQKLQEILLGYFHALLTQVSQSALCHRFHKIDARLSRWLLDCHYHTGKDVLYLTHEIMAMMLGTSRTLITSTASKLQQVGAISYRAGRVTILNRKRLDSIACECHEVVKGEFAETLGI